MPNRKVSHLRAKLEGGSVGETFDIYDESAVHVPNPVIKPQLECDSVLCIGDSYVEANSLGDQQANRFSTKVSGWLGYTEYNYAIGGTGFLAPSGQTFNDQITTAANELSSGVRNKVRYVFVCGGRNDPYLVSNWTLSALNTAISDVCDNVRTNFPNATIVAVPMLWDFQALIGAYQNYLQGVINCWQNQTRRVRLIRTGWTWLLGKAGAILSDNVHPNATGHNIIAIMLYQSMVGSDAVPYPKFFSFTSNGLTTKIKLFDNKVFIDVYGTPSAAMSFGGWILNGQDLGVNCGLITGSNYYMPLVGRDNAAACAQVSISTGSGTIKCNIQLITNSMSKQEYHGHLEFENGIVY